MNPIQLDTTAAATDTIQYVATDQTGLTETSTRTVIIEPDRSSPIATSTPASSPSAATTTGATSTSL